MATGAGARTLSVVICAYTIERWSALVKAVASVRSQEHPVQETIVVIDHNEELLRMARTHLAGTTVLSNDGPKGLSSARNTGWAAATGDVVAFLDDDAWAEPAWSSLLLAAYEDADVIGVGGAVRPEWQAATPRWLPEEFYWVVGCSYRGQPEQRADVRNAIGANMSFRREVLAQVGGFSTAVGRVGANSAGCEETELSIRACDARPGARLVLEPRAVVHHLVPAERTTRRYFRRRCLAEGRSKAVVSHLVGPRSALRSERSYVSNVLPAAVRRDLHRGLRGDGSGALRVWAIAEGLVLASMAYVSTRVRVGGPGRRSRMRLLRG